MNFFKDLAQFLMDRLTVVPHLGAEVANQATASKLALFEKVNLNVQPIAKPIQRLYRIIPERFFDVLAYQREIPDQEFEAECVFRFEVIGERPLRHASGPNDIADSRAAITTFENDMEPVNKDFLTERWLWHDYSTKNTDVHIHIIRSSVFRVNADTSLNGFLKIHYLFFASVKLGVGDDHMNVLFIGGRTVGPAVAWDLVQAFLVAQFSDAERHLRRLSVVHACVSRRRTLWLTIK
jgi:hypothetical protein